ncbi:IS4 family transposase [Gordonia sp. TBRC 11910]|uniref:IS4 family transposase n=1 Tax=Gordonia asplenii TaxID=2725283 RepID=A0A848L8L5_9ACTN|nr:IS4 family transposase [Gordonia asplenii]NMO05305.1 IS4 family transposase [Gordonia asplenii]
MPVQSVTPNGGGTLLDPFGPAHLGELTAIVPVEMVDAVLSDTGATQSRLRRLPSRVVVYLLLAAPLFADVGYEQVWARLTAGLRGCHWPGSSALSQARRRVGPRPLRALFEVLAGDTGGAHRWHGLVVCAIDGTTLVVPDSEANRACYRHVKGTHGGASYPIMRVAALVACSTRTLLDVTFGPDSDGEIAYATTLFRSLRSGMLVLGDRAYDSQKVYKAIILGSHADLLIRASSTRKPALIGRCADGTWLTRIGSVTLRVIDATIDVYDTNTGILVKTGHYRLLTSLLDPDRYPAADLVDLYHQRWEIETTYLELKSTLLHGRVLRARTPDGIEQELYALLATYQALRLAIADAVQPAAVAPDRASFTIALNTARDRIIHSYNAKEATTTPTTFSHIAAAILARPLPPRRSRSSPRVVKRAISKHRAKGPIDRTNHHTQITITTPLTTAHGP